MFAHPVIDRAAQTLPLDLLSCVLFAVALACIAVVTWQRPAFGIALLIVTVPFDFERVVGPTTIGLPKVALLGAVAGLLARRASLAPLRTGATRVLAICGIAVALATLLSIAQARYRGETLRETLKALEYVLLFATVAIAARAHGDADRERDASVVRLAIVGTLAVVSVLALAEEAFGAPSGIWFLDHPIPRIAGPLDGPNQLAGYLGVALCIAAAYALGGGRARAILATIGLGSAALVLTLSRAGIVTTFAALGLVAIRSPRRAARGEWLVVVGGIAVGLVVLGLWGLSLGHSSAVVAHLATTAESAHPGRVGTRTQLWHAAMTLWRAHPFWGIGAGNYERELGLAGYPELHTHSNSLYLQALVEGGLPLLLATLTLVIASIAVFARGPFTEPLVVGALAASVALAAHQVLDLLVFYPKVGEMWWIALALGAARRDVAVPMP
ncbi:MAG: hypothetical protein NVS4B5_18970 [Vulcanimicrobiaceae bacterium]